MQAILRRVALFACGTGLLAIALVALASDPPKADEPPERLTASGVIKEVNTAKRAVVYSRNTDGSYGLRTVTDVMALHERVSITLNGTKCRLSDLRAGDLVMFEYDPKPERAFRVTALTREAFDKLQKEKDKIKEYERTVEAEHLRMIKEMAHKGFAKDLEKAKEKAKADAEKAKEKSKGKLENKDKDGPPMPPPAKDTPP